MVGLTKACLGRIYRVDRIEQTGAAEIESYSKQS